MSSDLMKVAILSKADRFGGGASRMAQELCLLLQTKGHTAHHYLGAYQGDGSTYQPYSLYGNFFLGKFIRRLNFVSKFFGFPELIPWETFFLWLNKIKSYDLIHFHDLSSAISPLTVRYLARTLPTIWTFHDCSPFTGGCLQPLECQKFRIRCGQCPQIGKWPLDSKFDFTAVLQDIKRSTALENKFIAVAPSVWMANMAKSSGMFAVPPQIIPNGVNVDIFKPLDKLEVRQKFGLPADRSIILVIASNIGDELKGIKYVVEALTRAKSLNPYILLVGQMDEATRSWFAEFEHFETGYIKDDQLKAEYFAAADLFLFCSIGDNMPLVVLETMATATPTVGFATGGVPEMIEHGHSGYLVPPKDVAALVDGLRLGLVDQRVNAWGQQARDRVVRLFSHQIFLNNYLNLYQTVIKNFQK